MSSCLTCAKTCENDGQSLTISEHEDVQNALCKHFWYNETEYLESTICCPCWRQIDEFHRFYSAVEELYANKQLMEIKQEILGDFNPKLEAYIEADDDERDREDDYDECAINGPEESSVNDDKHREEKENFHIQLTEIKQEIDLGDFNPEPEESMEAEDDDLGDDNDKDESCAINDQNESSVNSYEYSKEKENDLREQIKDYKSFSKRKKLDAVQRYVSQNMVLECDTCSKRYTTFKELWTHSKFEHTKLPTVRCCNLSLKTPTRFADHIWYHLNPSEFKCLLCSSQYRYSEALSRHIQTIHAPEPKEPLASSVQEGKPSEIDDSDESSGSEHEDEDKTRLIKRRAKEPKEDLEQIKDYVAKNLTLECDTCSERFTDFDRVQDHSILKHDKRATVFCCNHKFRKRDKFQNHVRLHINPDRFKCSLCQKQCTHQEALNKHTNIFHAPEGAKYFCKVCNKPLVSRTSLRRHERTHPKLGYTKFRKYQKHELDAVRRYVSQNMVLRCDTCNTQCRTFDKLRRHSTMEHGKPATVRCCELYLRSNDRFVDHIWYHLNPSSFKCSICSNQYSNSSAIKAHMKSAHASKSKEPLVSDVQEGEPSVIKPKVADKAPSTGDVDYEQEIDALVI